MSKNLKVADEMEEEEWRIAGKSKQWEIPSMKVDLFSSGVKFDLEF